MSPVTPAVVLHDNSGLSFEPQPELYARIIEAVNQRLRGIWTLDERLLGRKIPLREIIQGRLFSDGTPNNGDPDYERWVKYHLIAVVETYQKSGWQISLAEPYTYISQWVFHFPEKPDALTLQEKDF